MKSNKIEGLQIIGFHSHSQLGDRGVKEGDWILEYNGEEVTNKYQLRELELKFQNSRNIILKIRSGSTEEFFQILPGEMGVYLAEREKSPEILSDAKRIENIEQLERKSGMENSFFGSLMNILKLFKVKIDSTTLMGLSAFPFRIQFREIWTNDMLDPTEGFDCAKFLFRNINWEYRRIERKNSSGEIDKAIIDSIDNGLPILAKNLFGGNEWGIITGYQNKGKDLFCRSYNDKTIDYSIAPQNPDAIIIFSEKPALTETRAEPYQLIEPRISSLKAVELLHTSEKFGEYLVGNAALLKWQNILENEAFFDSLDEEEFHKICVFNQLLFKQYGHYSQIANVYLESLIEIFPESKEHLKRLGKFYRSEGKVLSDCQKFIPISSEKDLRKFWTQKSRNNDIIALIKVQKKNKEILAITKGLPLFR